MFVLQRSLGVGVVRSFSKRGVWRAWRSVELGPTVEFQTFEQTTHLPPSGDAAIVHVRADHEINDFESSRLPTCQRKGFLGGTVVLLFGLIDQTFTHPSRSSRYSLVNPVLRSSGSRLHPLVIIR